MRYSVAVNWDYALLEGLEGKAVEGLYGQIWNDPLGGGRMALFIPKVEKEEAAAYIAAVRQRGLSFNYLINACCFDNLEFTKEGYKRIREHLEWIASTGADAVTVALPFLLKIVKEHYPQLRVYVSSFARVNNLPLARQWSEMGADRIILPEAIARDFATLRAIRRMVSCELELIANHCCLYQCPFDLHHRNMVSHGSQYGHPCGGFALDYCKLACQRAKLLHPDELIKARWIRPEDVDCYEEIGINSLKLVERFRGTVSLLELVDVYERRRYDGDLARLLTLPQEGVYMAPNVDIIERPDLIYPEWMAEVLEVLRAPFTGHLTIDNRRLEGFLEHFARVDCLRIDCQSCGYCRRVAEQVISWDEGWRQKMIRRLDEAIGLLIKGKARRDK